MNGYLAFDPDRVRFLEAALRGALEEMDTWHWRDAEAARAGQLCARAREHLDRWPVRIRAVAACGALTDLLGWAAPNRPGGFALIADTLPALTAEDLTVLRAVLVDVAADPDADLGRVSEGLAELSGHPGQLELFVAELGAARLTTLVSRWWHESVPDADSWIIAATPEPLLGALQHLGAGLAPALAAAGSQWNDALDDMPVFAASIMFGAASRTGQLGSAGADAAASLAERLDDLQTVDPRWRQGMALVIEGVTTDADTALRFLDAIDDATLSTVVFRTDPVLAGRLLLTSNDPSAVGPDAVRSSVLRVVSALAELQRSTQDALSGPTWRPEPYDRHSAEQNMFAGGLFDPALPFLPDGLGVYVARYLPQLVAPLSVARAEFVEPIPWDLGGRDDDVAKALVTVMGSAEDGSLALRLASSEFLAFAARAGGPSLDHAAYAAGAIEDAARSAHVDAVERHNQSIEDLSALVGFGTNFLDTPVGMVTSYAADAVLGRGAQDVREVMAAAEAEGADTATMIGYTAVAAWRLQQTPQSPPLGPLGVFRTGNGVQDRADTNTRVGLAAVEEWAEDLPDDERRAALDVYRDAVEAATSGMAFVAG